MKKYLLLSLFIYFPFLLSAQANCTAAHQLPIVQMQAELKRGLKSYKKQKPPVYYLSYTYTVQDDFMLWAEANGVMEELQDKDAYLEVSARAGSVQMDNTRTLKNGETQPFVWKTPAPVLTPGDALAFRRQLWLLTQQAVKNAQEGFSRVQADSQTSSQRVDNSNDFVLPPPVNYCRKEEEKTVELAPVKELLVRLSNLVRGNPLVRNSGFAFIGRQGQRYFVDSAGSQLVTPFLYMRLSYYFEAQTPDGLVLERSKNYDVLDVSELPDEATLRADIQRSLKELEKLSKAPEADPITVPAILKNRAMAVFVHEVLGHRMEGHRQKQDSFGKTFTSKVGQLVTAPFISIVDDATLRSFNGEPLRGFYEYDDEGVRVRPVVLVQDGVLREFLMNSSPIEGFNASSGHGRRSPGRSPVARMGVTRLIASQTVPYEELEKQLLAEIKRQQKPYGYVIDDLSGGFTMTQTSFPQVFKLEPKYVYRLYPDGRKEVVRGADMVGTPLVSFSKIKAAANDDAVFNGDCGAESGWVPVSSIAPSVLLEALEIEKTAKETRKPPILPSPMAVLKGAQK